MIIDRSSREYIEAEEAESEAMQSEMIDPPDISAGKPVEIRASRKKSDEVQHFLKSNTLAVLERLYGISTDNLYSRDEFGQKYRVSVPPGVQLAAATNFLDRSMGKPQVNIDLTSDQRPIMIDAALSMAPLIQASIIPENAQGSTGPTKDIESYQSTGESQL